MECTNANTGVGVTIPTFIPPLVVAVAAHVLVQVTGGPLDAAAPVAYIAGTLGTLIGADLLNLPRILRGSLVQGGGGERRWRSHLGLFWRRRPHRPQVHRQYRWSGHL
jgi:uncharacterized membrane protein